MMTGRLLLYTVFICLELMCTLDGVAQINFNVFDYWPHRPDPSRALYQKILVQGLDQLDGRKEAIHSLQGKQDWMGRQKMVSEKLRHMLLPAFEKSPLNARITGIIDRTDFVVEKIIYESLPGYPVSAAMFIPKVRTGPAPAILFCSGHSQEGFRSKVYQHMILNYVKKGFIVFAFDPVGQGERNQYFTTDGTKQFSPTHEHSYVGNQIFLTGFSPAQYMVWDAVRALDYMETRPEIDASRMGVTGRSGGGTQSAYLMAIDDRIMAAAPECYLTTFEHLMLSGGPQDAEQNILDFLDQGLDLPDLVEVRAPKPTLMVTTTRDIFSIQGARDLFEEAKRIYSAYGYPENISMIEDDAPHQSTKKNREDTYLFFQKHLRNPGAFMDEEVELFSEQELWVTSNGQLFHSGYGETLFSIVKKQAQKTMASSVIKSGSDLHFLKEKIMEMSGYEKPVVGRSFFSGATNLNHYSIEKYLIETSDNYYIPLVWLKPDKLDGQTVVIFDDRGKATYSDTAGLVFQMLKAGHEVIIPDLSGYGEMSANFDGDAFIDQIPLNIWYAGALTKKYPVAIRAEEIQAINYFVGIKKNENSLPVAMTFGTASTDLLTAIALGVQYKSVFLHGPLISMESLVQDKDYLVKFIPSLIPGAMTLFDFSDMINLSGAPVSIFNPVGANGLLIEEGVAKKVYQKNAQKIDLIYQARPIDLESSILKKLKALN